MPPYTCLPKFRIFGSGGHGRRGCGSTATAEVAWKKSDVFRILDVLDVLLRFWIFLDVFGVFLGRKTSANAWVGSGLACIGLYFLSVGELLTIGFGDSLLLVGAVCWAAHILVIDHFTKKVPPLLIALGQFIVCGVMGLIVSSIFESTSWEDTIEAKYILIYAGLITVGVAYTLQVVAQEKAHPTHAAIILSLEAVFGAIGGYAFLNEVLTSREFFGCCLMLLGMLCSQVSLKDLKQSFTSRDA